MTPDGERAITIYAYGVVSRDPADLMDIPRSIFGGAGEEVISPFEPLKTGNKKGIKGEFRTKGSDGDRWLVLALHSKQVFAFIIANDSDRTFQQHRDVFSKILDSFELHDPK